jgi:GGDEF domain-containing protein
MFLKIIRNYNTLKHLAYYDMLTGLLNRNWFYKNINKLKYKYVYFIDINDLHKINKHGHAVGDEHIKKIILGIKHNGVLLRYAGDEFLLFSNNENEISTNSLISVGVSKIEKDILAAINIADAEMLKSKKLWKSQ